MSETKNEVIIRGYLCDNKIEKTYNNSDGGVVLRGSLTVLCNDNNQVRASFYVSQLKKDKTLNKQFSDLESLLNKAVVRNIENGQQGTILEFTRARLENRDYYDKSDQLVKFDDIRGAFVREIQKIEDPEKDLTSAIQFTGYIENMIDEIRQDQLTGRLILTVTGIDYRGMANTIPFIVEAELADNVKQAYMVGQTVNLYAKVRNQVIVQPTPVVATAWGKAEVEPTKKYVREYITVGGDVPITEDSIGYISPEMLKEAKEKKEQSIQEQREKTKARQVSITQPTGFGATQAGFGGIPTNGFGINPQTANMFAQGVASGQAQTNQAPPLNNFNMSQITF